MNVTTSLGALTLVSVAKKPDDRLRPQCHQRSMNTKLTIPSTSSLFRMIV